MRQSDVNFPKVLILAQNKMQPFTGGGVVLSNLFDQFPADHLMFLHRDQDYDYQTPYTDHRLIPLWLRPSPITFLRHLGRWVRAGMRQPGRLRMVDLVRLLVQSCRFVYPRSLDRQIRNFEPHILYAWVADRLWAETVRETAQRYQLPYVIHFMDSHVGLEASIPVEKALYPSFLSSLSDVVRDAEALYTISDSMGQAYKTQWDRPYEVFHGVIESRQWPWPNIAPEKPVQNSDEQESSFNLVFTGSVEQGQMIGLKEVATAVDELLEEGVSIRLVLYLTGAYAERVRAVLGKYRCLEIKAHPDFASLRKELATADALILAYGFDQFTRLYYKYSFATKIVPYMMSGRPILVYGPQGIEPVEYALRGDWSLCVTTGRQADEGRALKDGIRELMDDPERRKFLARSAWKAGAAEHDQAENADRFRASLLAKSSSLFLQIHSGFKYE